MVVNAPRSPSLTVTVREIAGVITTLTTGSPAEQQATLENYFLSNASFSHPFCRVPSFPKGTIPFLPNADSRSVLLQIYRWYRTLSPEIHITIDSAGKCPCPQPMVAN